MESMLPQRLHSRPVISFRFPLSVATGHLLIKSHVCTVLSLLPEKRRFPAGLQASAVTDKLCAA